MFGQRERERYGMVSSQAAIERCSVKERERERCSVRQREMFGQRDVQLERRSVREMFS